MKKIYIILSLALTSCYTPNTGYPGGSTTDSTLSDSLKVPLRIPVEFSTIDLNVVVIDSCEYLYGPWGNATVLTHKGNCQNPIHTQIQRYSPWKH
jgi:hypothetical protein